MHVRKPSALFVRRYLAYFLAVLMLPVLVMTVIYFRVSDIVTYNAYQQALASMQNSAHIIQEHLKSVESLSYHIAQNSQTSRFFMMDSFDSDQTIVSDVFETQRALSSLTVANNIITGIQLYSRKADLIIDARTSAISLDRYYGSVFSVEGYDVESWRAEYLLPPFGSKIAPSRMIYDGRTTKRRITFIQPIPLETTGYHYGSILVYIDEEEFLRMFQAIPYQDVGLFYILDVGGERVMEDNPGALPLEEIKLDSGALSDGHGLQSIDGVEQLVIYYNDGQWQYVSAIPHAHVLASTNTTRLFLVAMIAVTVAGGVLLAVFYAYKTSQPVISVYRQLTSSGSVPPNALGDEIAMLVQKNDDLKDLVDQQLPAQQTALVYSLLSGGFSDPKTLVGDFAKLGISLEADAYLVLVAVLTDLDSTLSFREIGIYKEVVKELLWGGIPGVVGVCDMDFEHVVLLAALPEGDGEALRESLADRAGDVSRHAREDVGISLYVSASIADQLTDIPATFISVQNAVRLSAIGECQRIHWCDVEAGGAVFYPEGLAAQLLSAVKEGRTSLLFSLWKSIEHHNVACLADPSPEMGYRLLQMVYTTLLKAVAELPEEGGPPPDEYQAIATAISQRTLPTGAIYARLQDAFLDTTVRYAENVLSRNALLVRILDYVDANYSDPQISLTSVAVMFHMNEVYLSRVFKRSTGENFSRHIETLRMRRANELIRENQHRISEISLMVGYNSPQVFRRAYKRCFGISPSKST